MKRFILCLLCGVFVWGYGAARQVYKLDDGWVFSGGGSASGNDMEIVSLPHTWNTVVQNQAHLNRGQMRYHRTLYVPDAWRGKRLFVKFYGVDSRAVLFCGGKYAGSHVGAGSAFVFELTQMVAYGENNELSVLVDNTQSIDYFPLSTVLTSYGGINRPVELILTDKCAISPLYYGSEGVFVKPTTVSRSSVEGTVAVYVATGEDKSVSLTVRLRDSDGRKVFEKSQKAKGDDKVVNIGFAIQNPQLWSLQKPQMYSVDVLLESDSSRDSVTVGTGFRQVELTQEGVMINGEKCDLNGVVVGHDSYGEGSALVDADYERDFRLFRELGANSLRSREHPHAALLYRLTDMAGVAVAVDMPLTSSNCVGDVQFIPSDALQSCGREQVREVIYQNYNHPSVMFWGLFSMLNLRGDDVIPYLKSLNTLIKSIDPSRPTYAVSNQDGQINFITDMIVLNQNVGWQRGQTSDVDLWCDLLRSNFKSLKCGAVYGAPGFYNHSKSDPIVGSASAKQFTEQRQTAFHEDYAKSLVGNNLFYGLWVDALFDYGTWRGEIAVSPFGLVSFDRSTKKDIFYLYKALFNKNEQTLHISDSRWLYRDASPSARMLKIYSSHGEPKVTVNGVSQKVEKYATAQYRIPAALRDGENEVVVSAADKVTSTVINISNAPKQRQNPAPRKIRGL